MIIKKKQITVLPLKQFKDNFYLNNYERELNKNPKEKYQKF